MPETPEPEVPEPRIHIIDPAMQGHVRGRFAHLLGELVVEASPIERTIQDICAILISEDTDRGRLVSSKMSFSQVCDMATLLARDALDAPGLEHLTEAIGEARSAMKERNRLIHGVWGYVGGDSMVLIESRSESLRRVTEDTVSNAIEALKGAGEALIECDVEIDLQMRRAREP